MSRQNDMAERYAELKCTPEQIEEMEEAFARADKAQREFERWDQASIDRTIQSVAQIVANSKTFHELVELGIQARRPHQPEAKRFKTVAATACCLFGTFYGSFHVAQCDMRKATRLWHNIQHAVSGEYNELQWPFPLMNFQDGHGAESYVQGFLDAISEDKNIIFLGQSAYLKHSKSINLAGLQEMLTQPLLKKRLWQFM